MFKNTLFALGGSVVLGMVITSPAEALTFAGSLGSGEVELFQFEATGLFDFLNVNTNGSNFDTELGLYDSSGNLIANDDDGGFGLQSNLLLADSPSLDGILTAVVGGFDTTFGTTLDDITAGSSSGEYVLSIDTFDLVESTTFSGSFPSGGLLPFSIVPAENLDLITVDTEGSKLDTELGLYDADGNLIDNDDDGGPGLLSNITALTSDGGNYNGSITTVLGAFDTSYGPTIDDVTTTSTASGNYQVNIKQYASTGGVKTVPEPAGVVSFLAFGTIAVGSTIKRKLIITY